MATLKLTSNYMNSYEAAHKILSNNPWYQESDWLSMARSGDLDQYITVLANTDKITDKDKFYSDYNYEYADSSTRTAALYNEILADRTNNYTVRQKLVTDENGNAVLDYSGKPKYEKYYASDYDYYKSIIKSKNDENYQEFLVQQEKERKDSMNGFVKVLADIGSVVTEYAYGLANQIDNLANSLAAVGDGIGAIFRGENPIDAMVKTNASENWRFFEQMGVQDWIIDFERRYTGMRDFDGEYSNIGKYFGGVATTMGQMLPSMLGGKLAGTIGGLSSASTKTVNTISEVTSTLIFYQAITAGNVRDTYKQMASENVSVSSGAILANATIKSALQWAVEVLLARKIGGSGIDNVVFGRSVKSVAGKSLEAAAGKRLLHDFVKEGLEEVFQDTSDWFVDRVFSLLINENFGELTNLTYESLMDSFVIGGLASFAGSALNILVTKRKSTGEIGENGKPVKLSKLASWEYGLDMDSFMRNYVDIQRKGEEILTTYGKDSKEAKQWTASFMEMYSAYRMITSIYNEIGEERFKNANEILGKITKLIDEGKFNNKSASTMANIIAEKFTDLEVNALKKTLNKLGDAGITMFENVVERGADLDSIDLDPNTRKAIQEIFDGDENVQRVILAKDGANVVVVDNTLFIPINYARNADGSVIYETVAEQTLVNTISEGKFKGLVLDTILDTFRKVTGRKDANMQEAIYNLVFNQSFFNIMLSTANKDMLSLLSSLIDIESSVVSKNLRNKIYKKKIATVIENMTNLLYNYFINNPYVDYQTYGRMFTKSQLNKIAAARWCRNLYARVINNATYKKLTDSDWEVLNNRVNSLPVKQTEKDKILAGLKSDNKHARTSAMNRIAIIYKGIFTTKYDGKTYMPDTNIANRTFNAWLQSLGLTIETVSSTDVYEDIKNTVANLYGEFNKENLIKFRQTQFMQSCNNSYVFRYDEQSNLGIYEHETNEQVGFSEYKAETEAVIEGKDFEKRTILKRSIEKNYIVKKIINDNIDSATAAYLSIDDIVTNPSLLSNEMQAQIQMEYGSVNSTSTFLYLRRYFINEFNTTTLIVLSDGTYAFADILPMKSLLKNENFEITDKTKIWDIIKDSYLQGRLKDVKIKLTDRGIVAEYNAKENVIYINKEYASRKDNYLTFAILHEFQHAIQVENRMNLGINANWINSSGISKAMKREIIDDVRKHRPELFEGIKKNSEEEANIVNDFVYYSSGESTAYGIDASQLINFYPTIVSIDKGITITFPWGKSYSTNVSRPLSIAIRNFSNQAVEILNTKDFENKQLNSQNFSTMNKLFSENADYYRNLNKEYRAWNDFVPTLSDIAKYVAQPIGTDRIAIDIKNNAKKQLLMYKERSLRALFALLKFTPDVTFEQFLDMDMPIYRIQNNKNIYNDSFVSFGVVSPERIFANLKEYFDSSQEKTLSNIYLIYGKVKPRDLYGYVGTSLNEVFLSTNVAKNLDKLQISTLSGNITTLQNDDVYTSSTNIKKSTENVMNVTATVSSAFDVKNVNTKFSSEILKRIHVLSDFSPRTFSSLALGNDVVQNSENALFNFESSNSQIFTNNDYKKVSKSTLLKIIEENNLDKNRLPVLLYTGNDGDYAVGRLLVSESDIQLFLEQMSSLSLYQKNLNIKCCYANFSNVETCTPSLFTNVYFNKNLVNTSNLDMFGDIIANEGSLTISGMDSKKESSELGNFDAMSIKRPKHMKQLSETEIKKPKRYVTQREAKGTNLEKFGYTAKYKRTQMDTKLKNFIITANEDIATELWSKLKTGKLTTSDVMDYLREAENIDDKTFKLINDAFFQNSKIKTFTELKKKISESPKYYAMRAVLKSAGFGEALLTNANPELLNNLLEVINKDSKLKKLYDKIESRYYMYNKESLDISEKYLRKLWMEYFDGTVETGSYISAVARLAAICRWRIVGEGSTLITRSLSENVGKNKDMQLEEVIEDTSAKDAFDYILNNGDRTDRIDEIMKAVTPKLIGKLKKLGRKEATKYLQSKREELEQMDAKEFIRVYKRRVERMSEEDINKIFLKTIVVETAGIDVSKLNEQQLDKLEISADMIAKKVIRPNRAIVNNIKSIVRTIKANISKKEIARFLKDNGDIFDENLNVKKELYQTREGKRLKLKEGPELLALEDRVRQLSKRVRANDYSSEQSLRFRKRLDKQLEKLRIENERLASKLGTKQTQAVTYEIGDDVITIDTKKEIPVALKRILESELDKFAKSTTQYLTEEDQQHVQMNLKKFIVNNAEYLATLTQNDVDEIIDFYLTSEIIPSTNKVRQYTATQIYLLAYIITNSKTGRFLLTDSQREEVTNRLESMVSISMATGAAWKSVLPIFKPEETLIQSLAKSNNIEFAASDVQALVEATTSGDITRIQNAKKTMYENALRTYKGRKQTFFDRVLKFERMAMLSGPGTWVRNQASNILVSAGNIASERASSPVVRILEKLFPKTFKHKEGQYKIIGTEVKSETRTFIKKEVIDSGLLDLIRDGLSKYDTRKHKSGISTSQESLSDMIENSIRTKIERNTFSKSKLVNNAYSFLFKMLSDDRSIDKATIYYLGKILTEDNVNLNEGLSTDVLNHIVDAYVMAAEDFMHKTNFFNDIEYKLRERLGDKAFFVYKQFLPFASASWNWFMEGLNYTPVGLGKAIVQYAKLENTIEKMDSKRQKGERVVSSKFAEYSAKRNIGKGVIGTIGMGIGAALAAFGCAGIDEEDDTYKLRIGDVYIDISDIFGTQGIFAGIAVMDLFKGTDPWSFIGNALDTMFLDSTFTEVFNSFRYSDSFGEWLRDQPFDILNMFVPNFLKTLTSLTYGHKVQYDKGLLGKLEKIAAQSVPGLAYVLPKQYDPYTGEYQIQYKAWFLTKFVNKLSPLKISVYNISEQEKIAISLGIKKSQLKGSYEIDGEKVQLTSNEIRELNEFYGKLNEKELKEFISGNKKYKILDTEKNKYVELTYSKMTDEQKATVINRIMSNNSSKAKIYMLTKNGSYKYYVNSDEYNELKKLGINVLKETDKKKGLIKT